MTLLVCVVAGATLSSVGGVLLHLLRPYMPIVTAALVVGWFAAALTADAVTHPQNDHDENPGEEDLEDDGEEETEEDQEDDDVDDVDDEETDPWPAQRELLRKFIEHRVTAGASGFKKGVKGRGARVDDLLAEQQEHGGLIGLDRKGMIALIEKAGLTVREQMKFHVREDTPAGWKWKPKNVPGVHIEDLAKDLGRNPNLPANLVPDLTPTPAPIPALVAVPNPAQETPPIPLQRAAGE